MSNSEWHREQGIGERSLAREHETISKLRIELAFALDQVKQLQDKCQASKVVELEQAAADLGAKLAQMSRAYDAQVEAGELLVQELSDARGARASIAAELQLVRDEFTVLGNKYGVTTVDLERAQARVAVLEQEKQQLVDELAGLKGQMARRRRR